MRLFKRWDLKIDWKWILGVWIILGLGAYLGAYENEEFGKKWWIVRQLGKMNKVIGVVEEKSKKTDDYQTSGAIRQRSTGNEERRWETIRKEQSGEVLKMKKFQTKGDKAEFQKKVKNKIWKKLAEEEIKKRQIRALDEWLKTSEIVLVGKNLFAKIGKEWIYLGEHMKLNNRSGKTKMGLPGISEKKDEKEWKKDIERTFELLTKIKWIKSELEWIKKGKYGKDVDLEEELFIWKKAIGKKTNKEKEFLKNVGLETFVGLYNVDDVESNSESQILLKIKKFEEKMKLELARIETLNQYRKTQTWTWIQMLESWKGDKGNLVHAENEMLDWAYRNIEKFKNENKKEIEILKFYINLMKFRNSTKKATELNHGEYAKNTSSISFYRSRRSLNKLGEKQLTQYQTINNIDINQGKESECGSESQEKGGGWVCAHLQYREKQNKSLKLETMLLNEKQHLIASF